MGKENAEVKLIIPGRLPSENEIIAAAKGHWNYYREMKKTETERVAWHAKEQKIRSVQKADFTITWYCPDTRREKDNIMAGQKFIFDGLVQAGVLPDDRWKNIGNIWHRFEIDKKNPRVEVLIYPL